MILLESNFLHDWDWIWVTFLKDKIENSSHDSLNLCCSHGNRKIPSSSHYLQHCSQYCKKRSNLLNNISYINSGILENSSSAITWILLFEDASFNDLTNTCILNSTLEYMIGTKRFDEPFFISTYHYQIPF